jgi:hypothetical protein
VHPAALAGKMLPARHVSHSLVEADQEPLQGEWAYLSISDSLKKAKIYNHGQKELSSLEILVYRIYM